MGHEMIVQFFFDARLAMRDCFNLAPGSCSLHSDARFEISNTRSSGKVHHRAWASLQVARAARRCNLTPTRPTFQQILLVPPYARLTFLVACKSERGVLIDGVDSASFPRRGSALVGFTGRYPAALKVHSELSNGVYVAVVRHVAKPGGTENGSISLAYMQLPPMP